MNQIWKSDIVSADEIVSNVRRKMLTLAGTNSGSLQLRELLEIAEGTPRSAFTNGFDRSALINAGLLQANGRILPIVACVAKVALIRLGARFAEYQGPVEEPKVQEAPVQAPPVVAPEIKKPVKVRAVVERPAAANPSILRYLGGPPLR